MIAHYFAAIIAASVFVYTSAECPNACSSHGKCGAFDMCVCYRNWMANDCSERICPFGLAHVDTPKGDLDASSGKLSGPGVTVIANDAIYPYGTEEQFPSMFDSEGSVMTNSAHWWSECSNKGLCDRASGTCGCFEGYAGANCQRANCPSNSGGSCSGHGTCETIKNIAKSDFGNHYNLWDEEVSMGCKCDGGYAGADCSEKVCKFGTDPLYYDDYANIRYANFTYQIYTTTNTTLTGNYSIFFEDRTGEDWETAPISINADCDAVTNALEALPNNVIPSGSVRCYQHTTTTSTNTPIYDSAMYIGGANFVKPKFTIAFPLNPGYLKQIAINKYLDGTRPTLYSAESTSTLNWHIYANGFTGEDTDLVPDYCEGVTVTLSASSSIDSAHSFAGLTTQSAKALKRCLGDSDGDLTNNVEVYNWDYGTQEPDIAVSSTNTNLNRNYFQNPHLVKLVDATQDTVLTEELSEDPAQWPYPKTLLCSNTADYINTNYGSGWCPNRNPAGFYAVIYYDYTHDEFVVFTRAAADYASTTEFHVFTTTGFLRRVSPVAAAFSTTLADSSSSASTRIAKYYSNIMYLTNTSAVSTMTGFYGQVDCETNPAGTYSAADCLNKDDLVMFLSVTKSSTTLAINPIYPNLHRVKRIGREDKNPAINQSSERLRHQIVLDYGVNAKFTIEHPAVIYKFHPPTGYNYVAQCSNRGLCNTDSGLCECFSGYTTDNCGLQNALAV